MSKAQGIAQSANQGQFKNRIINGAMVIDQRNAGAVLLASNNYSVDRWYADTAQINKFTMQQNASGVAPPTGFTNYLGITSSSSYSVAAGEWFLLRQKIEGFNVANLDFGTSTASPVTLSFWVRSSLTGTFGGSLSNSAQNRNYIFAYTINSANTWEYKTVTIAGDTTGTWLKNSSTGLTVSFSLGVGATWSGDAGSWNSSLFKVSPTGATSVVGTSGATFYITGVQLEKGSTATSFDYRPYGTELALCQRYYQKLGNVGYVSVGMGLQSNARTNMYAYVKPNVEMRASPTAGYSSLICTDRETFETDIASISSISSSTNSIWISLTKSASGTALYPVFLSVKGATTGYLELIAEL